MQRLAKRFHGRRVFDALGEHAQRAQAHLAFSGQVLLGLVGGFQVGQRGAIGHGGLDGGELLRLAFQRRHLGAQGGHLFFGGLDCGFLVGRGFGGFF